MALKIYHQINERDNSDTWHFWILFIPLAGAYVKIAGARVQKDGTIYEKYSKHGRKKNEFETKDKNEFVQWFQERFGLNPFDIKIPNLPDEIKLRRHSDDSKRIFKDLSNCYGSDLSVSPDKLINHYSLKI